jgi:hypothetical protein
MKFRTMISLATMFLLCFTVAVWSQPVPSESSASDSNNAPDSQSIAGKISAVGDASFTMEITNNQSVNTVQFMIDEHTKVEGKLAVGSQASVEYKSDSGKNVATHVVVTQTATLNLY